MKKRMLKIICFFTILSFITTSFSTTCNAEITNNEDKPTVKVAFIWQKWDILDILLSKFYMKIYEEHLKKGETKYNVSFEIFELWDDLDAGDVQSGILIYNDIDVVVGPGGFGTWNCPSAYRAKIKEFVDLGGSFYGICGDSSFGTLGFKNLPTEYRYLLKRHMGFDDFTPMLGLVNVYMDVSSLNHFFKHPLLFNKFTIFRMLLAIGISRGLIQVEPNILSIQQQYIGQEMTVQMGSPPLIDGPTLNRLFMPKVYTVATFEKTARPYNNSIIGDMAVVAARYKLSRVVLSTPHPELAYESEESGDFFVRNILWCAKQLPFYIEYTVD